jgi:hypothetical protein
MPYDDIRYARNGDVHIAYETWGMSGTAFDREVADIDRGWGTRGRAEAVSRQAPFEGASFDEQVEWTIGHMRDRGLRQRVRDEEAAFESILATAFFTDIVGSTERQAELGDVRWHELIAETTTGSARSPI